MSQTNVTLTCPEGRWNLISFLNVSSSILACITTKKDVDHDDLDKVATHLSDVVADGHLPDLVAVLVKERVHCDRGSVLGWGADLGKHDMGQLFSHDIWKWNIIFLVLSILLPV